MGRIAVVTGGTRGIGAAISKALKADGCTVAAIYADNEEAASSFRSETGIATYKCDVTSFETCAATLKAIESESGPIDILVNNAGITRDVMFHKMSLQQWRDVINTNLDALFNITQPVWGGMRDRSFGRIICISSINGQKGQMGQTNYAAAKAGEIGFVKSLALEGAARNITVNAICPGYINTAMMKAVPEKILNERIIPAIPVGRLGEPEDIARCVSFLASDGAGFITGATLSANGGQLMS